MTNNKAFSKIRHNSRPKKPRSYGVTEIRGPYYNVMGERYLRDIMETMGEHVDIIKFAGGSFSLMPEDQLINFINICHVVIYKKSKRE